jgi:glutathione S-transferase
MGVEKPRPIFEPTFFFEEDGDTKAVCDSTPIIRRLEEQYTGRSVLPDDPALAFIDYLIEDFADEWCTKYMFHYLWHAKSDAGNASTLLPLSMDVSMPKDGHQEFKRWVEEPRISRLYMVGSNDTTAPVIDASYRRFLTAMENHLGNQKYMLGNRHQVSPRTVAWVDLMRDQSGLAPTEQDWISVEDQAENFLAYCVGS